MKILFIGDIVAKGGRLAVSKVLPEIRKEFNIDLVFANAENLSHGRGFSVETIKDMQLCGVDYFTGGDHLFWQKSSFDEIENLPIIRPANYSKVIPGQGFVVVETPKTGRVLLINLIGRSFFNNPTDDPFTKADEILAQNSNEKFSAIVVDFHAEATSEKSAMGFYLDGRVTAVVGTHTHIPTCDTVVLPKGTLFVSDIGMSGIIDSVLGVKKEIIIKQYLTGMNQKFDWEETGRKAFRSVLIDTNAGKIVRVDRSIL